MRRRRTSSRRTRGRKGRIKSRKSKRGNRISSFRIARGGIRL